MLINTYGHFAPYSENLQLLHGRSLFWVNHINLCVVLSASFHCYFYIVFYRFFNLVFWKVYFLMISI